MFSTKYFFCSTKHSIFELKYLKENIIYKNYKSYLDKICKEVNKDELLNFLNHHKSTQNPMHNSTHCHSQFIDIINKSEIDISTKNAVICMYIKDQQDQILGCCIFNMTESNISDVQYCIDTKDIEQTEDIKGMLYDKILNLASKMNSYKEQIGDNYQSKFNLKPMSKSKKRSGKVVPLNIEVEENNKKKDEAVTKINNSNIVKTTINPLTENQPLDIGDINLDQQKYSNPTLKNKKTRTLKDFFTKSNKQQIQPMEGGSFRKRKTNKQKRKRKRKTKKLKKQK